MRESWASIAMTNKMYGWSKWGGAREGLVKEELEEWYCQACGDKQIQILPCYMFPMDHSQRDFVRVCTLCKAKAILKSLDVLEELLRLVR